jgi:hypothetical protein
MEGSDGCVELNMQHQVPRLASGLVHPCVLVADLDCLPALDVAHAPSRFEHNPGVGLRRVGQAAPRSSCRRRVRTRRRFHPCESRKQAVPRHCKFTGQVFLLNFSLPNFYFHYTTAYDILRNCGVELAKRDFIGTRSRSHKGRRDQFRLNCFPPTCVGSATVADGRLCYVDKMK